MNLLKKEAGRLKQSCPRRLSKHDFVSDGHATVKLVQHDLLI